MRFLFVICRIYSQSNRLKVNSIAHNYHEAVGCLLSHQN